MSILSLLLTFIMLVLLVAAIALIFWKFSLKTRSNPLSRDSFYTIIRFENLETAPDLSKNDRFMQTGDWEYSKDGNYWKGFARVSREKLRQFLRDEYQLQANQVIVTVPEELKIASAIL